MPFVRGVEVPAADDDDWQRRDMMWKWRTESLDKHEETINHENVKKIAKREWIRSEVDKIVVVWEKAGIKYHKM